MADKELFGISEQLDCSDCVNHGGDWDCDHVHCRKGTDTISRRAALDAIKKLEKPAPTAQHLSAIFDCEDTIEALPSAQPERKKGHWIEINDSYNRISGKCSVCGWESHMYEDDVVGMDFCPNCGARLDGEQNDT